MRCGHCYHRGTHVELLEHEEKNPNWPHECNCDSCEAVVFEYEVKYTCPIDSRHHHICVEDVGVSIKKYDTKYGALSVLTHKLFDLDEQSESTVVAIHEGNDNEETE